MVNCKKRKNIWNTSEHNSLFAPENHEWNPRKGYLYKCVTSFLWIICRFRLCYNSGIRTTKYCWCQNE